MSDFHAVLLASGFVIDRVIPDGRWHRVKTIDKMKHRNGAYLLRPDGRVGYFKNWATDQDFNTWRAEGQPTQAEKRQSDARILAARQRDTEYRARSIQSVQRYWAGLQPLRGGHPYLYSKQLDMRGCSNVRVDGDLLVIPVMRDGQVMSVQTVAPDGTKGFEPGCPVKGGIYLMDRPGAVLTAFAEGFATGLAVYQSINQCRVVVCFDSGNLVEVARHFWGRGLGVVCADNDKATASRTGTNPGLVAGQQAAELMGCGLAFPEDIEGTDWADAITELGENARGWVHRKIMMKAKPFRRPSVVP